MHNNSLTTNCCYVLDWFTPGFNVWFTILMRWRVFCYPFVGSITCGTGDFSRLSLVTTNHPNLWFHDYYFLQSSLTGAEHCHFSWFASYSSYLWLAIWFVSIKIVHGQVVHGFILYEFMLGGKVVIDIATLMFKDTLAKWHLGTYDS